MVNITIIDAWNVCYKIPEIADLIPNQLEKARNKFNIMVKYFFKGKDITYKIIYDGQSGIISEDRDQSVKFSRNPEKADDLIIRYILKQKNRRAMTLVTSDRQLALRARDFGVTIISAEAFTEKLNRRRNKSNGVAAKINPQVGKDEINYWLNKFSSDDPDE
jgi:predicted RNA-binding protein with PIN domain